MNTHLTQEEIILTYYGEHDRVHVDQCAECGDELARISRVLDSVTPPDVPEPADDYESRVWNRLSWRLRGEKKRSTSNVTRWLATAAMLAIAFTAGIFVRNRRDVPPPQIASAPTAVVTPAAEPVATGSSQQQRDRILLVVVGDHFDESERVLVELTNLTPSDNTDISAERARAEELLASNRLYRRTAVDRGEESVATLLDELEPVLLQIAHADAQLPAEELRRIQKRVEAKGLVFKLRVVRADVRASAAPKQQPTI